MLSSAWAFARRHRLAPAAAIFTTAAFVWSFVVVGIVGVVRGTAPAPSVVVEAAGAAPLAVAARPYPLAFSVGSAAVVPLQLSATAPTSGASCVVTTSATPLYLVAPTAADTSQGEGPFCTDCAGGARFAFPASRAYARTSAGTADVRCSFYDGDTAPTASGGGGGGGGADACEKTGDADCELTGQFRAPVGTTTSSGYGYVGGTNTGMFFTGSNLSLYRGGNPIWGNDATGTSIACASRAVVSSSAGCGAATGNAQIQASTVTNAPRYTFHDDEDTGWGRTAANVPAVFAGSATPASRWSLNQTLTADGTLSLPSVAFASEPNTGVWRPAGGNWNVAVLGSNRLNVTGSWVQSEGVPFLSNRFAVNSFGSSPTVPSIYEFSDTDTGVYYDGVNRIGLTSGGEPSLVADTGNLQGASKSTTTAKYFRTPRVVNTGGSVLSLLPTCDATSEGAQVYVYGFGDTRGNKTAYVDLDSDLCLCARAHGALVWMSLIVPATGCGVNAAP